MRRVYRHGMGRWLLVLAVAACGSRSGDAPPTPAPRDAGATPAVGVKAPAAPPFDIAPPADKLVAVGRSDHHACVVRESGAVDCWGTLARCEKCELGAPPDPSVRRIAGITDAIAVSADGRCFVRKTGEATCFNDTGTLVAVPGIKGAVATDTNGKCFLDAKGGVTCVADDKPWSVTNLRDAVSLVSSELATCAVRRTGTVMCGSPDGGQPWAPVRGLENVKQLAMTGGFEAYTCAVIGAKVRCFMMSPYAEAGQSITPKFEDEGRSFDLKQPALFANATQLAMWRTEDYQFHLAAIVGGKVIEDTFNGDAKAVPLLADAAVLARECAIRAQGSLVCWGENKGGALAQPTTIMNADVAPTTVVGLTDVADIALGTTSSYALTRDGRVWWWGKVGESRWGSRTSVPEELKLGLGPTKLVQVVAGRGNRVCMRGDSGEVWCHVQASGSRIEQLDTDGVRDMTAYGTDVVVYRRGALPEVHTITGAERYIDASLAIEQLRDPDAVEVGYVYETRCARHEDGTVMCPRKIEGITAATKLVTSDSFGCVIQRGRVWCWLDTDMYQRGPLSEIPALRDVTDLASSPEAACAVHGGGRVSCWTYREQGGDAGKTHRTWDAPVEVIHGGAADVELGRGTRGQYSASFRLHGPDAAGAYGCARMIDRTVQCWGMSLFGELGDGSFLETATPIGVKL